LSSNESLGSADGGVLIGKIVCPAFRLAGLDHVARWALINCSEHFNLEILDFRKHISANQNHIGPFSRFKAKSIVPNISISNFRIKKTNLSKPEPHWAITYKEIRKWDYNNIGSSLTRITTSTCWC
jgi:hypothetical protein